MLPGYSHLKLTLTTIVYRVVQKLLQYQINESYLIVHSLTILDENSSKSLFISHVFFVHVSFTALYCI